MKIFLHVLWSLAILLFVLYWLNKSWQNKEDSVTDTDFNVNTLDSLFRISDDEVIITIGSRDCDICDNLMKESTYVSLPYKKVFCVVEVNENNKLISQALFNTGFPISYIIDKEYNIKSIIQGRYKFSERVSSFYISHDSVYNIEMESVDQNSIPKMLSWAFRGVIFYWQKDFSEMKNCAYKSLQCGEYFFNNYLLYLYFERHGEIDSLRRYKEKLLKFNSPVNKFVYGDLIYKIEDNNLR